MFPVLALETSSPLLSVAIRKSAKDPVAEETLSGFLTHAENLIPMIERLLKKKKLSISDINTFLIGRGPGSFTGLRVGFATLKGFLALKKRDCFGALSLDLIAENIPSKKPLWVVLDAHREKFYARSYHPTNEPRTLTLDQVLAEISAGAEVTGDALVRYKKQFDAAAKSKKFKLLPKKYWYPKASSLILMKDNLAKLEKPADFVPLYFRLSEAEERNPNAHNLQA